MERRTLLWWGTGSLLAATALGALIVLGFADAPAIDRWWNTAVAAQRAPWLVAFAHGMNFVGGSRGTIFIVGPLIIIAFVLARRWRSAVFAAMAMLTSAGVVQVLKHIFGRARPDDMLVMSDFGSFPSGHVANAATVAVLVWVLFPRMWTAIAAALWVLAMAYSRTLLSVHWATDTLGGALVGAGAVLMLSAWLLPWVRQQDHASPPAAGVTETARTEEL
ncbi:phosphatase PAP2 family protein [Microbacterium sp. SD291]|uniref:phosphatase PAP2 family protein n=1 Tax=Microbacterium sp. SD291 TaxID=2782007 RepID=UPI001A97798B|nr:phosphatase PAP2 family protein [Microbacterium sp. SD291]MBO0980511.1 phosphatase PAP2 family protein [Microbacterium sp. SD291]